MHADQRRIGGPVQGVFARISVGVVALAMLSAGCSLFGGSFVRGRQSRGGGSSGAGASAGSMDKVTAARSKKDLPELERLCMRVRRVQVAKAACKAAVDLLAQAKNRGKLMAICRGSNRRSNPYYDWRNRDQACDAAKQLEGAAWTAELDDCEKVKTIQDRYEGHFGIRKEKNYYRLVFAVIRCGHWNHFWTKLVHQGSLDTGRGMKVLGQLDRAGKPVLAELRKYLNTHRAKPFGFRLGSYAANHVLWWLMKAGKAGDCRQWLPYARNAGPLTMGHWLTFFARLKCTASADLAVPRLASSKPHRRSHACAVLGMIGNKRHIPKLRILARTDPVYRIRRLVRIYWVRDACRAAIGKIRLRS